MKSSKKRGTQRYQKKWSEDQQWKEFRKGQAERFGMPLGRFDRFFKEYPKYLEENLTNLENIFDKRLKGRKEIAAFIGIHERTLKTWILKYPDLPIVCERVCERKRYFSITSNLLSWRMSMEASRLPEDLKLIAITELSGLTGPHVRKSLSVSGVRLSKNYRRKTVEKAKFILMQARTDP